MRKRSQSLDPPFLNHEAEYEESSKERENSDYTAVHNNDSLSAGVGQFSNLAILSFPINNVAPSRAAIKFKRKSRSLSASPRETSYPEDKQPLKLSDASEALASGLLRMDSGEDETNQMCSRCDP